MTTRPAAEPLTAEEEAAFRLFIDRAADGGHAARLLATLDRERAERANLRDRLRRIHYPPQIGTHYEQGFADCLRAVLAEFERP